MVSEKVQINNPSGLHLRPAGILCKEAMKYKSLITFEYAGRNCERQERSERPGCMCEMR